ncbi:MAG: c-type cytochrome biogenesis protein CcsB [Candidatus Glassbacteria bacterium]
MWLTFTRANLPFQLTTTLYAVAALLYLSLIIVRRRGFANLATLVYAAGLAFNILFIVDRWMDSGRPPFKTLFESLVFLACCVAAFYLVIELLHRVRLLGIFATIGSFASMIYALMRMDMEVVNLLPALQSGWFIPHVMIYFIAYAALFLSFVTAILYMFNPNPKKLKDNNLLGQEVLDFEQYTHGTISFGFTALVFGLLIGAVWAKEAWGDYWVWDPKESWALITMLIYAGYLHLRLVKGWKGRKAAWFAILGFAAVMFTYLGMHLLPTAGDSAHVYTLQ